MWRRAFWPFLCSGRLRQLPPRISRAFVTLMRAVSRRSLRRLHPTGDPSKRTRPPSPIFPPFFYPSLTTDLYSDCPGLLWAIFGKIRNRLVIGAASEEAWHLL